MKNAGTPTLLERKTSSVAASPARMTNTRSHPTIWGLTPVQLHDHAWAARGVSI